MKTLEGYAENMRYDIRHYTNVVATTDHLDIASGLVQASPIPITLVDTWTGKDVPVPGLSAERDVIIPTQTITELLGRGQKILAIKLIRELNALGLGESKGIVDRIEAKVADEARNADRLDNNW